MPSSERSSGGLQLSAAQLNPFTLRVGQVFTGFGVGCGIGIGFGGAFNVGAIHPSLGEAASSLSRVGYHVQTMMNNLGLKKMQSKLGLRNVGAGIGCGVGFGHGFGVGVALKPGAMQRVKQMMEQCALAVNEKLKATVPNQSSQDVNTADSTSILPAPGRASKPRDPSQKETVLGGLVQTPSSRVDATTEPSSAHSPEIDRLRSENQILRILLTHREQIEDLKKENAALRRELSEQGRANSSKSGASSDSTNEANRNCFECRRLRRSRG